MLARLHAVRTEIAEAVSAAGRDPGAVRLLLATKTQPADRIIAVLAAGERLIGENRAQEVVAKLMVRSEMTVANFSVVFIGVIVWWF